MAADEAVASEAAAVAKGIKDKCESDLAEAMQALNTLKPSDISMVKTMKVTCVWKCVWFDATIMVLKKKTGQPLANTLSSFP